VVFPREKTFGPLLGKNASLRKGKEEAMRKVSYIPTNVFSRTGQVMLSNLSIYAINCT
jgi:hypothetical protein